MGAAGAWAGAVPGTLGIGVDGALETGGVEGEVETGGLPVEGGGAVATSMAGTVVDTGGSAPWATAAASAR